MVAHVNANKVDLGLANLHPLLLAMLTDKPTLLDLSQIKEEIAIANKEVHGIALLLRSLLVT